VTESIDHSSNRTQQRRKEMTNEYWIFNTELVGQHAIRSKQSRKYRHQQVRTTHYCRVVGWTGCNYDNEKWSL